MQPPPMDRLEEAVTSLTKDPTLAKETIENTVCKTVSLVYFIMCMLMFLQLAELLDASWCEARGSKVGTLAELGALTTKRVPSMH